MKLAVLLAVALAGCALPPEAPEPPACRDAYFVCRSRPTVHPFDQCLHRCRAEGRWDHAVCPARMGE